MNKNPENSEIDKLANDLEQIVRKISFPRFFGTKAEIKTRNILKADLDERGLQYTLETFNASDFFMRRVNQIPYFIQGLLVLVLVLSLLLNFNMVYVLVLSIALLITAFCMEGIIRKIKYPAMYSRFADIKQSENIVIPDPRGDDAVKHASLNIHFVGHTDSKTEWPNPNVFFLAEFISVFFGSVIITVHGIIYALYAIINPGTVLHSPYIFLYGLIFAALDMLRIITRYFPGESQGAVDDAIGVAMTILLLEKSKKLGLKNVEVTGVLSGAEEVGEVGAYSYVEKRKNDPGFTKARNHFIILDGLGGGDVIFYFPTRGLQFKKFSIHILNAVEKLLEVNHRSTKGFTFKKMWMPPPVNTDHNGIVKHGYPAFVFASPGNDNSHSKDDTPDKINYQGVARFVDFLLALLKELDSK